jgi:hypothetical protein
VPRSENLEVGDYTGYYETSDGRISGYEFTQSYPVLAAYIAMLIGGVVLSLYGLVVYTKPRPASKE